MKVCNKNRKKEYAWQSCFVSDRSNYVKHVKRSKKSNLIKCNYLGSSWLSCGCSFDCCCDHIIRLVVVLLLKLWVFYLISSFTNKLIVRNASPETTHWVVEIFIKNLNNKFYSFTNDLFEVLGGGGIGRLLIRESILVICSFKLTIKFLWLY